MGAVMKDVSSSCTTLEHRREYVDLPFPENKGYLTEKAEHALKFPKVILAVSRKTGKTYTINQRQTAVTGTIRADELTHAYLWDYKAEVSFDMTTVPTTGIATPYLAGSGEYKNPGKRDPLRRHSLNPFPPGHLVGYLRRPDIIIVKTRALRWPGRAGVDHDGSPHPDNLARVVEMKFPDDELREDQKEDYILIAGGEERFTVLDVRDCEEERERERKRSTQQYGRPSNIPLILPVPGRRDDSGGEAPAPVTDGEAKPGRPPVTTPGGTPGALPVPAARVRQQAPVYSPVPQPNPAWYESWLQQVKDAGRGIETVWDELRHGVSELSDDAQQWLRSQAPWLFQAGRWVHDGANDTWVWVNEKGEQVVRWTMAQLRAVWAKIERYCDIAWEAIRSIDWGQFLIDLGKNLGMVVLVIIAGVAIVFALPAELVAGFLAALGIGASTAFASAS